MLCGKGDKLLNENYAGHWRCPGETEFSAITEADKSHLRRMKSGTEMSSASSLVLHDWVWLRKSIIRTMTLDLRKFSPSSVRQRSLSCQIF